MIVETPELAEYRRRVRGWLATHVPDGWRSWLAGASPEELLELQRWWLHELREPGYAAPHWPTEFGGGGTSLAEQVVLEQELQRAAAPDLPMFFVSLNHVGATLIAHGTPQQRRHLEAILEGEVWCQGFSEPNAGSDLASLTTRAERRGDVYVVNGQKVWSSLAQYSQWCILLARTDPRAPKRRGISFFLLDMATPGVEVRPIRQLTGEQEFCEVFLTDVEIPADQLVGAENTGWAIAQTVLSTERGPVLLQLADRLRVQLDQLLDLAIGNESADDAGVRQLLGRSFAEVEILSHLCDRLIDNLMRRSDTGAEASVLKVYFSELLQRITAEGVEIEGLPAFEARPLRPNDSHSTGLWLLDHLASWRWTIAAGTNQIQRNLIGERGLGLPREPVVAR